MSPPETCPHCGAEVPPDARVCPECGADENTGWNDRATTQRLGASDPEDFDADEFESSESVGSTGTGPSWGWILVAIGLLAALLWALLR